MDTFKKQPGEAIIYTMDFTDALKTGDTVSSVSAPVVTDISATPDQVTVPTVSSVSTSSTGVSFKLSGGIDRQTYKATASVTTIAGEILEHEFKLRVREL